jgi:hypothetical protein
MTAHASLAEDDNKLNIHITYTTTWTCLLVTTIVLSMWTDMDSKGRVRKNN